MSERIKGQVQSVTSKPCHECTCHLHPPCSACEHCMHGDVTRCLEDCQTCEYDHWRTGPYRLADGTWSDGVKRSHPMGAALRRVRNPKRVRVWKSRKGEGWTAFTVGGVDHFNTHAEAIAYADKQARTTTNGETK